MSIDWGWDGWLVIGDVLWMNCALFVVVVMVSDCIDVFKGGFGGI